MSIVGSGGSLSSHASVQNGKYSSSDVSMSGNMHDVDYSLMLSHDSDNDSRAADLYTSWKNDYTSMNSGATLAREYRQLSLGASGNLPSREFTQCGAVRRQYQLAEVQN